MPFQRVADPIESLLRDLIAHAAERGNRDHLQVQLGPELVGEQGGITGQFSDRAEKRDQFGRLHGLVDVLLTCIDVRSPKSLSLFCVHTSRRERSAVTRPAAA